MTPEEIEGHARHLRTKANRIYENSPYKNFQMVKDVSSVVDDLCELVIALAENQKRTPMMEEEDDERGTA